MEGRLALPAEAVAEADQKIQAAAEADQKTQVAAEVR